MPRRTKEEAEQTRRDLLDAALLVFGKAGYSAARLSDVAAEAKVTRGAIYHHFKNKAELFRALVSEKGAGANAAFQALAAAGGTPRELLERQLTGMIEYVETDDEYRATIELAATKTEMTDELKDYARDVRRSRRMLASYFESLLREGIKLGEFREDLEVEDAAVMLVGLMNGLGLIWIQDSRAFSLAERARSIVNTVLTGLEP
jgi:TetR/AcrR family acrAB operon transcriptional repressor